MIKRETLNKLLLLHLIQVSDRGILGTTKLQKMIFVLEAALREEVRVIFNYKFIRWHYGPYCSEIQKDIEYLEKKKFIGIRENGTRKEFYITDDGLNFLNRANDFLDQLVLRNKFERVINDFNTMALDDVLRNVYEQYRINEDYNMGDVILPLISDEEMSELLER